MIYEHRVYTVELDKQASMIKTIEGFCKALEKQDVKALGVFHPVIGDASELSYYLIYESMAHREQVWNSMYEDEDVLAWYKEAKERAEQEGGSGLLNEVNTLMTSTEYSSGK